MCVCVCVCVWSAIAVTDEMVNKLVVVAVSASILHVCALTWPGDEMIVMQCDVTMLLLSMLLLLLLLLVLRPFRFVYVYVNIGRYVCVFVASHQVVAKFHTCNVVVAFQLLVVVMQSITIKHYYYYY